MFKVFDKTCNNCLLSKDRIVSARRAKEIINECAANQTHFVCHKASMKGEDVCCKTFYDTLGYKSQMISIAQHLDMVKVVSQTDTEKLIPYDKTRRNL